ncbi:uncharacterized protein LOC132712768 isoform X2 [Ruditapes philippinarum]|uniref:uncharacterized protein LOC132712768 isoform X2 n=1 Tax=Ruditapes philippinarum TaxID=129788 RepID=UPI00295B4750|nr:uncharacterized protein LOC132712768 isoform X2 [Ruditapes philippinarum]
MSTALFSTTTNDTVGDHASGEGHSGTGDHAGRDYASGENYASGDHAAGGVQSVDREVQACPTDLFLNKEELYLNLLYAESESVKISDGVGLFMVLPELDFQKCQLKKDLILLERKYVTFNCDNGKWIYMCSCQPVLCREMKSSFRQYTHTYDEFLHQFKQCEHRRIASVIFDQHDDLHQIEPQHYLNFEGWMDFPWHTQMFEHFSNLARLFPTILVYILTLKQILSFSSQPLAKN